MRTVLVVEDEPDLLVVVQTLLGIQGYDVIGVDSGEDALERIDDADAILLDIRLPGISGFEVVEQLDDETRRRVLFMSAHADLHHDDVVDQHGCAGFLVKPFDFDEMCHRLEQILA